MPRSEPRRCVATILAVIAVFALHHLGLRAQQVRGELVGQVEVSSNTDRSLSILTVDLDVEGKNDGKVDHVFVVIRPTRSLNLPRGNRVIRPAAGSSLGFTSSLEIVTRAQPTVFVVTPEGKGDEPRDPKSAPVDAKGIWRLRAFRGMSHKETVDYILEVGHSEDRVDHMRSTGK